VVPRLARPGDVVLTLGAGDLTTVPDVWLGLDPEGVTP
jgi:UDP-N-acetylmuramate-alanine ligase